MKGKRRFSEVMATAAGLTVTLSAALVIAIVLIFLLSDDPGRTIYYFFLGPFTNRYYLGNLFNSAIPLIFAGLGIAVAFSSSCFNLGGEGQVYSGALVTTAVCLALPNANGLLGGVAAIVAGMIAGGVLAGLSGYFNMKWGTDLLISSFLISAATVLVINFIITGPLDDPASSLLATPKIADQYHLLKIFKPSKLDISIIFALFAAAAVFLFMYTPGEGMRCGCAGSIRSLRGTEG